MKSTLPLLMALSAIAAPAAAAVTIIDTQGTLTSQQRVYFRLSDYEYAPRYRLTITAQPGIEVTLRRDQSFCVIGTISCDTYENWAFWSNVTSLSIVFDQSRTWIESSSRRRFWLDAKGIDLVGYNSQISSDEVTFSYRLTLTDAPPAVPEPATWAMMIAGFGLVGIAARRRVPAAA